MSKPTVEDLEVIISQGQSDLWNEYDIAVKIHSLYNVASKPLVEIRNDQVACAAIADELKIKGHEVYKWGDEWFIMMGLIDNETCKFGISATGDMYLEIEGFTQDNYNFFNVIKLILSLGYDAKSDTP